MRHIWKILFIVLLVATALVYTKLIDTQVDKTGDIANDINETISIVDKATADRIIKQVENAYSSAYMINMGYPTLEQVKSSFGLRNVIWNDNYIIEANNFNCPVEVINNNLKVTCLDFVTQDNLLLSIGDSNGI